MDQRIAANSRAAIFAGIRSLGTEEVSRLLGCAESTVSELSSEAKYKLNFHNFGDLLARMNLKIVPASNRCMNPEKLEAILKLAEIGMAKIKASDLQELE
jgi:hypothetical protein